MLSKELVISTDTIALIKSKAGLDQLGIDKHIGGEFSDAAHSMKPYMALKIDPISTLLRGNSISTKEPLARKTGVDFY